MRLHVFKSKIHQATVTNADLNYEGSITIDMDLVDLAGMIPNEKVQVVNNNNGARFETYIIKGKRGSGTIQLNGAAARLATIGDEIIIITYAEMEPEEAKEHQPTVVLVDKKNRPKKVFKYGEEEHEESSVPFQTY